MVLIYVILFNTMPITTCPRNFCNETDLLQCTVLEVQVWFGKCRTVTRMKKVSSNFSFHYRWSRKLQCADVNKPLQKVYKRIYHYIHLLKLCNISIILLLANNLTNIYNEISKTQMNLWLAYLAMRTGSRKLKRWGED